MQEVNKEGTDSETNTRGSTTFPLGGGNMRAGAVTLEDEATWKMEHVQ